MWKESLYGRVFPILLFLEMKFNTCTHSTICMTHIYEMYIFQTPLKHTIHSQLNCAILLCNVIPDGKMSKLRSFDRH